MFDYAVSNKKIILFVYDKEEYLKDRGLYVDLDEIGLPQAKGVTRLQKLLRDPDYDLSKFRAKFCPHDRKDNAVMVCDEWIRGVRGELPVQKISDNGKEKVLVFTQRAVDRALVRELNARCKEMGSEESTICRFRAML